RSGARVLLADEGPVFGGGLLGAPATIDGAPSSLWLATAIAELERMEQVTLLRDATVFGHYEHSFFAIAERRPGAPFGQPRQRLWKVRAGRAIFATGAIERPLVFPDNDRPGIMLASSVRRYLHRFAVLCGRRAVVVTNNDSAYAVTLDLHHAGAAVAAVVELREAAPAGAAAQLAAAGIPLRLGHAVSAI